MEDGLRRLGKLFGERQDGAFHRRQRRVEVQHDARVVLLGVHDLLVVGVHKSREQDAVHADGGLDAIRDKVLAGFLVEIAQVFAGVLRVGLQVKIGAGGDAPQLAPAEGEQVLDIGGGI